MQSNKVAILNDTHSGIKNGSDIFLDYMEKFYRDVFFPYCEENGIKTVIHLGDYYDHRKYVNYKVLRRNREMFIDRLVELGMTMHIIPGNHDVYWKNTNDLCSLTEQLVHYDCIKVHMEPTILHLDSGLDIALLPWITDDNQETSLDFIANAPAPILMGHLELEGFKYIGNTNTLSHGMNHKILSRYEMVLSGHYHTASRRDNVIYLGTQYELTWSDYNDSKGFHVLDTNTRELEKVINHHKLFHKVSYDDSNEDSDVIVPDDLGSKFVKVVVVNKKDPFTFDQFLDMINVQEPFDLRIVESFDEFTADSIKDQEISLQDTNQLLNSYVDAIETDLDKERIKKKLQELYVEAQSLEIA